MIKIRETKGRCNIDNYDDVRHWTKERLLARQHDQNKNKAVYATASVAYGWAGVVMGFKQRFGKNFNSVTDRQTE